MRIAVIGTGYVGLVTGTCLSETGNEVTCVDIDADKVAMLKQQKLPIYEPGLENLFERNFQQGRLQFTIDLEEGIEGAEIIFLALPTPSGEDGSADLSYVLQVAEQLSPLIEDYTIIVNKSTVPVGTGDKVRALLANDLPDSKFDVVSNPEFMREGVAVEDFLKPDRVVIGASSEKALKKMRRLYEPFVRQGNPIIEMDIRSAEMTKYASNSYLAMRISYMNEMANLCDKVGANVDLVRIGMGADNRIGKRFLFPGIGYGGSCFPKDVRALVHTADEHKYSFDILKSVKSVNRAQKEVLLEKLEKYFEGSLQGKRIAIWGLSFKPETDDVREAPSLAMIDKLLEKGAEVAAYDPEAMNNVRKKYGSKIELIDDQYSVLDGADALLIATEWSVFRSPDFEKLKSSLANPLVFDGRNVFEPGFMKRRGFEYFSIGRPAINSTT